MNKKYHGFSFTTKQGNEYYYDDLDGTVLPTISLKREPKIKSNPNIGSSELLIHKSASFSNKISNFLKLYSHQQLILIVTEQCNLRCRYCAFSGNYTNNRIHHDSTMTWQVAVKALKQFHESYIQIKTRDPSLLAKISFYGGEPLLNFELIRNLHPLVKDLFHENVLVNLTTNSTILKKQEVDFFVDNDFHLLFSLNGDRDEHDRLRVFSNGLGSFDAVWHNIQEIRNRYPDYFRNNCGIVTTTDTGTNLFRLRQFYEKNASFLPQSILFITVTQSFTNWYSKYSREDYIRYRESFQELKEEYLLQLSKGKTPSHFFDKFFGTGYYSLLIRQQNNQFINSLIPFTRTCVPGMKIAVSPDGLYHCCERINNLFPIGNIDIGLDISLIENIIQKYTEQISSDCQHCQVTRLCPVCFASVGGPGQFQKDPPKVCSQILEDFKQRFRELWSLFEDGVPESVFSPREVLREW
jgi:uncharacterized protein